MSAQRHESNITDEVSSSCVDDDDDDEVHVLLYCTCSTYPTRKTISTIVTLVIRVLKNTTVFGGREPHKV
jgi:hypothetical protein